ncbi:MAG: Nif3-like dinuclear metal center hexameric protein [Halalkalicoccus sp.]
MELRELCARYDERLRTEAFAEIDASANGLQIGSDGTVGHAAFAVDAAVETIDRAAEAGADVLCTHHGLVWGGLDRVTGRDFERVAALIENDLALYVSHLPLDSHPELGNAAGVAAHLGLDSPEPFGSLGPETIGLAGRLPSPLSPDDLSTRLSELDTGGRDVRTLEFGPEEITEVAVVTGSGADWLGEAADAGVDAFVTGEGKQQLYHEAREAGLTVALAGHYATETFGVRSLQELADEWGLETTWIDAPTGL